MRVLLSTVGSRGDVQPMVALASHLREVGHDARLCAPPGFDAHLTSGLRLDYFPVGHDLRLGPAPGTEAVQRRQSAAISPCCVSAATDCAVIVGCAAMQIATRSIAEMPISLTFTPPTPPSPFRRIHHSPPPVGGPPRSAGVISARAQWDLDAQWWNEIWGPGSTLHAPHRACGRGRRPQSHDLPIVPCWLPIRLSPHGLRHEEFE